MHSLTLLEAWTKWAPLEGAGQNRAFPQAPGLYRIRRIGFEGLDYVGQTGNGLRGRLGMLSGVYQPAMPYNDPHTAGPGLWALRHSTGCDFEASVVSFEGDHRHRLGLEVLAISLHRAATRQSPTLNFGRMPPGYRKSSGNNARLVAAGKRFRGGPDPLVPASPASVPVGGPLDADPHAADWLGLSWSPWQDTRSFVARGAQGLYRIQRTGNEKGSLLYIGQGLLGTRLKAHITKATQHDHRQAEHFGGAVEASVAELGTVPTVTLLEIENDLIASHMMVHQQPPLAQFLG